MRVIYADILFTINLAVDYLLLFSASRLSGARFNRLKALCSATLGAVYSLTVLMEIPAAAMVLIRFAVSFAMVLIAFGKRSFLDFLKLLAFFYACSFIFSGFMLLLNSVLNSDMFIVSDGAVYFELTAVETVICSAAAFAIVEALRRFIRHGEPEGVCSVRLIFRGKSTILNAFCDTGNSLVDPFSGSPVAICREELLKKLVPEGGFPKTPEECLQRGIHMRWIPVETISGSGTVQAFRPEKAVILNSDGSFEAEELLIGISPYAPENSLLLGSGVVLKKIVKSRR